MKLKVPEYMEGLEVFRAPRQIGVGVVMVCIAVSSPAFIIPLHLNWWQSVLLILPCWSLAWLGSVKASLAWIALRRDLSQIQQKEIQLLLDLYLQNKGIEEVP